MSDDEVMRFEITDHDLDSEFNTQRRRRPKKEEQIYGMWAKDSDDDENEDNVRQKVRKNKDYSAPIGFVAGGIQQAGKKKQPEKETKELESSEPRTSRTAFAADSSDEETEQTAPLESETAGIRRAGQGMRSASLGGNVGNWEKHTKGIGAKLLLQMGYQPGKGLGKALQGISAPVEASVRKGRGAIGAYGPEKAALKAKKEEERRLKEKEDIEKGEKGDKKEYHWKKSHKGRYFYRDASDVIQEGKPTTQTINSSSMSRVPVIDMTGRSTRVLSGYHALRANAPRFEHEPRRECKHFAIPELQHNLDAMLECCEQDIIENARSLHKAEDEVVVLQRDLEACNLSVAQHDKVIETMRGVVDCIRELDSPHLSLETAYKILYQCKMYYPLEYEMFYIGTVGGSVLSPLLSALLASWDPLAAPAEPVPLLNKWREVLTEDAYNSMLWQHFLPKVTAAIESWNPRSPDAMLAAVTIWFTLGGTWLAHGINNAVAARLLTAVQAWDPTRDTLPVHTWVLPWHQSAGPQLSASVYPLIRARLSGALSAWHPSDGSARALLGAWRTAWGGALVSLLHHHILPKLHQTALQAPIELLNPQDNVAWGWCCDWLELLGPATLASVATRSLLPRWLSALAAWLNTSPDHSTVLHSYTEFKKLFPDEILKEPGVRDAFRKALDMMNRSADCEDFSIQPPPPPPPPRFTMPEGKDALRIAEVMASNNQQKSFSELLETRCMEKGITFVPTGKYREGRPLYKMGSTMQCYVIRNVIMYSNDLGRTFAPISLDRILSLAED